MRLLMKHHTEPCTVNQFHSLSFPCGRKNKEEEETKRGGGGRELVWTKREKQEEDGWMWLMILPTLLQVQINIFPIPL